MNKLLRLIWMAVLPNICLPLQADEIVIDFSAQGYDNSENVTIIQQGGVTITFSKGSNTNGNTPKYYNTGTAIRLYGGNTMNVSSDYTITAITLSFDKSNAPSSSNFGVDSGEAVIGNPTNWTGSANSVTFTNTASSGHWRIQTIGITLRLAEEVRGIAALREVTDGTKVRLVLTEDNAGHIEWVDSQDGTYAYVRDNDKAVRFTNFLPNDPGWHTTTGGALIGAVDGEYHFRDGMPEFTPISTSIADSILCLDSWQQTNPIAISDLEELAGPEYRANYVALTGVTLADDGNGNYIVSNGESKLTMSNKFGLSDIIPSDLRGREFQIKGILGASDDGKSSELYYTQIDEIIPELKLNENLYTNMAVIGYYEGRDVNVNVNRHFTTNMWNTICLPFDIYEFSDIVSAAKLAEFTGYDATTNTLEFSSTENLRAGLPYLVYPTEEVTSIHIMGANIVSEMTPVTYGPYDMIGIYDPTTLNGGDRQVLFLGDNNTLYHPSVTNDLKAFRAYFRSLSDEGANTAQICVDGVVSDIHTARIDSEVVNSHIYNMSGQLVGHTTDGLQKGVYVSNGNKVVIK